MKVLFLSSEIDPFAKTGGLADVAGSLPVALERKGIALRLAMPKYRPVLRQKEGRIGKEIRVDFIEQNAFYDRAGLYGENGKDYPDNLERFSFFCRKVLDLLKERNFAVDLIHCNDWQTALVPVYLKSLYREDPFFRNVKTVFTIHNLGYQGLFPASEMGKTGLDDSYFHMESLEFYGKINVLKGGLVYADILTTVSPTYSREIQTAEFGHGLEGILFKRREDLFGIVNGIDQDLWDPAQDRAIKKQYTPENPAGKEEDKKDLQTLCGLQVKKDIPLIGIVSRLAAQKGFDILAPVVGKILKQGFQMVLLGTGDKRYEELFQEIGKKFPKSFSLHLAFDPVLARKIYAGSDFFLMPSRYEPCGLGQMIALRYGTIPVVRKTGGLADTIRDATYPEGNGFVFSEYASEKLLGSLLQAKKAFQEKKGWERLLRRAMAFDFSWDRSAEKYVDLYRRVLHA